jgi:hypothetical protein
VVIDVPGADANWKPQLSPLEPTLTLRMDGSTPIDVDQVAVGPRFVGAPLFGHPGPSTYRPVTGLAASAIGGVAQVGACAAMTAMIAMSVATGLRWCRTMSDPSGRVLDRLVHGRG